MDIWVCDTNFYGLILVPGNHKSPVFIFMVLQTSSEVISYVDAARMVIEKDGVGGLFWRGLKTKIITNGIQVLGNFPLFFPLTFNIFKNMSTHDLLFCDFAYLS